MDDLYLFFIATGTSLLSALMGLGGGTLLIILMVDRFPPLVLLPIHGLIQLNSNLSRAIFNYKDIQRSILWPSLLGAITGALIGSKFVIKTEETLILVLMASFIIVFTWLPQNLRPPRLPFKWFFVSGSATFLSMFVGATGPYSAPFFLTEKLNKKQIIATQAAYQVFNHGIKIVGFLWIGVTLSTYLREIVILSLGAWSGSYLGKKMHKIIPSERFLFWYKILLSVLALRILYQGLQPWLQKSVSP